MPVPYFVLAACAGVRGMCMHMCRRYGRTRGVSARRSMGYYPILGARECIFNIN